MTPVTETGAPPDTTRWHTLDVTDTLAALEVTPEGLSPAEVASRATRWGPNELTETGGRSALALLVEQLRAVMVLILVAAAGLSLLLGKVLEASAIAAIVVLFAGLGFVQEHRAERAIAALRRMSAPEVRVRRSGDVVTVPAPALVPGDIVLLDAGNVVPADLRLIEAASLRVQEAALTGESEPVDKTTDPTAADAALGDRRDLAFSGTQVVYGRGVGVVTDTGMRTELGRIATLLGGVEDEATPLQRRLDRVGKELALVGVVVAAVVMAIGAAAGESFSDLVLTAISVAVAVIPEGLPAVVTVTLAIGAQRMLRRQALIRKLPAVETLGSVTVICSDKTGTLTQNRMTVTVVDVAGQRIDLTRLTSEAPAAGALLAAAALCNDADLRTDVDGEQQATGDPTEIALLAAAATHGGLVLDDLRQAAPRLAEVPFDSDRKRMSTLHRVVPSRAVAGLDVLAGVGNELVVVKGALDGMLPHATALWTGTRVVEMDPDRRAHISQAGDELAAEGMRVLAVAVRPVPEGTDDIDVTDEDDLTFLGLVGMIDPPRAEVRDAVARCAEAGIRPVMITGDHPLTAIAIARQLGLDHSGRALTGIDLETCSDDDLRREVRTTAVFARVSPEHKLRIVEALKAEGEVVAMTGDGVNDAPALRRADIGVAMGITGTDVSKEASEMVLRDDNFSTIVAAVEEGRVIYDNLRRFVKFAVAGNLGKILVMLVWPLPLLLTGDVDDAVALLPLQLLWLNLMTDGLLGVAMGVEAAESDVMRRPPQDPDVGILSGGHGRQTAWIGLVIGALALGLGLTYYALDRPEWQTVMFTSLAFLQVGQALAIRSATRSLRAIGLRSNPTLLTVALVVVGLQLVALYTPLNRLLDVEPLALGDLGLCIAAAVVLFSLIELDKLRRRPAATPTPSPSPSPKVLT